MRDVLRAVWPRTCFAYLLCMALSHPAYGAILINEVLADPAAGWGDANRDGTAGVLDDEFIELVNTGAAPAQLDGWSLADSVRVRHVFAGAIAPRGFFVVFGGGTPTGCAAAVTASTGGLGLNNAGDTISLLDPSGLLMDAFTYGPEGGQDVSLTRTPDAEGPFLAHTTVNGLPFSPGTTVDGGGSLLPLPPPPAKIPDDTDPEDAQEPVIPELPPLHGAGVWLAFWLAGRRRSALRAMEPA